MSAKLFIKSKYYKYNSMNAPKEGNCYLCVSCQSPLAHFTSIVLSSALLPEWARLSSALG